MKKILKPIAKTMLILSFCGMFCITDEIRSQVPISVSCILIFTASAKYLEKVGEFREDNR